MKITIDDKSKTIEIDDTVTVNELLKLMKSLRLDVNEYKIVGTRTSYQYYPYYPYQPITTYPITYYSVGTSKFHDGQ